jgi:hypothetical protein
VCKHFLNYNVEEEEEEEEEARDANMPFICMGILPLADGAQVG